MASSAFDKFFNKGTLSGVLTILGGVVAIVDALGGTPPGLLISVVTVLGGLLTTKDSVDIRKK